MDVREYLTADGKNPYREWLDTLDIMPRAPLQASSPLLDGESRRPQERGRRCLGGAGHVRPGYRIDFGKDGAQLVPLLLGGDKSTQTVDVGRAQESRHAYQEGKRHGKTK
jgi:hypothetical protein